MSGTLRSTLPRQLLDYLAKHPGLTSEALAAGVHQDNPKNVRKCLCRQRDRRLVVSVESPDRSGLRWYLREHAPEGTPVPPPPVKPMRRNEEAVPDAVWIHPIRARALGILPPHYRPRVSA